MAQWLGLAAFTARGPSLITGQGAKISQAMLWNKKMHWQNNHQISTVSGILGNFYFFSYFYVLLLTFYTEQV